MFKIAQLLDASGLDVQIIAICGKSTKLEAAMRALKGRIRMHVEGFTREVPRFMRLADFFIGKPGPGSISEAIAMGLPVIIERNHWTLPQERYNADWVEEQGVGISLRAASRRQIIGCGWKDARSRAALRGVRRQRRQRPEEPGGV